MESTIKRYLHIYQDNNILQRKNKWISFFIVFGLGLLLSCCEPKKTDKRLLEQFNNFDTFLRTRPFHYDTVKIHLANFNQAFIHSDSRQLSYGDRKTTVNYKWNSDSSITMLNAEKIFSKGFSREVIIHAGDSVLFLHRFSTKPLGLENSEDYTFLESICYLAENGTISHLARIEYGKQDLKDTVEFRRMPFTNLADGVSYYYSLELNYSKNILTLN